MNFDEVMPWPLTHEEITTAGQAVTSQNKEERMPIIPVPEDAPPFNFEMPKWGGKPHAKYPYHQADGALIGYIARWNVIDTETGRPNKYILPVCYCALPHGKKAWRSLGMPVPRVLYRLPQLLATPDDTPVIITEGEKKADRVSELFPDCTATSPMHGAKSPHKSDWSPLKGRAVIILPDHDEAGRGFAQHVAELVLTAGARSVAIAQIPKYFPESWDIADPLPEGGDYCAILASAVPFQRKAKLEYDDSEGELLSGTEEALALEFIDQHQDELRYVASWGKWLLWDGACWRFDTTLNVISWCRDISRNASKAESNDKVAAKIASGSTVAAIEKLARADRRVAATVEQWDADLWLLNTPAGVVNLQTGIIRTHQHTDHMTKITATSPGGTCPIWKGFLDRVTEGNQELQSFLQRVMGYALTGITREHALFFLYGTGGNGKGVFLNTMTAILQGYGAVASMDTFTASQNDRHPTDLAMLRGARFVTAQETEEGRRWAESRIKALTGGDPVSARFMRQDFFTYLPQFKLVIAGNHKPGLKNVDEAMRRRLHLIPFTAKIPPSERDPALTDKLKAEWPGILQWAIDGAREWSQVGLLPPTIVQEATKEYLAEEDMVERWIGECCSLSPTLNSTVQRLYDNWKSWCDLMGESPLTLKRFSQTLRSKHPELKDWKCPITRRCGFKGIQSMQEINKHYSDIADTIE